MNDALLRRVLRGVAVVVAIGAVVDPAVTTSRRTKPVVVVAAADSTHDASLANDVVKTLNKRFTVERAPIAGANATVLVGDGLPDDDASAALTFAVLSDTTMPSVSIERLDVPATAPADARVRVGSRLTLHGAQGRTLDVTLRAGESVADRITQRIGRSDTAFTLPLSFVPTGVGATQIGITATLSGANASAAADAVVDVRDHRWSVLFYDARPSWTSTFVRRAIEHDPRFVVTSRVVTSRNVSVDAGHPPTRLDDLAALSTFDAVIIGAPEGLSTSDVSGLDTYMRRRGGSVVLLLDQRVAGSYDRLTAVAAWSSANTSSTTIANASGDTATLRATEISYPAPLPLGARTVAGGAKPIVWESAVGAGRLVVSGALDAWRFRDPSASGFDAFWRTLIADVAAQSPPPVAATMSRVLVTPGELIDVHAVVRDASLLTQSERPTLASISAAVDTSSAVRLWPAIDVGSFDGRLRAPHTTGVYRILMTSGGETAEVPFVVATDVHRATPASRDLLSAFTAARGGRVFQAVDIDKLPVALSEALRAPSQLETWHPMRSPWWIIPFVLALSAEWWLRRRRGLA